MALPTNLSEMQIVINDLLMSKTEEVEVTKTFYERWIFPIIHCATEPFEPWVKTKKVIMKVPSDKVYVITNKLIMHSKVAEQILNSSDTIIHHNDSKFIW